MKTFFWSAALGLLFWASAASGVEGFLDLEAGVAFTGYNDVRIPADSGTTISLSDEITSRPALALRMRAGMVLSGRHTLILLAAPLRVSGTGKPGRDILFQGRIFRAGSEVASSYRFDSYRLTYRYGLINRERLAVATGLTAKIRSADIAMMSDSVYAHRSDLGAVPLVNLAAVFRMTERTSLTLEADALASPYGRAEDALLALQYSPRASHTFRVGYRVLEGGADGGGNVYTFSMFHYLTAGITARF